MNNSKDSRIKDPEYEGGSARKGVLFRHDAGAAKRAKDTGDLPPGTNFILASYSQFQAGGVDWKIAAVSQWMAGKSAPLLIMDEAHRAAGETSRIGVVMTGMVDAVKARGGDVLYASGTPLKSGRNIRVYAPALPDVGMPPEQLVQLIESQPLALQEALSFEMARMGTFVSREMDQSGVVRELPRLAEIDPVKFDGMIQKMDRFAEYLAEMMEQSGEITGWARNRSKALEDQAKDAGVPDKALGAVQVSMTSPAGRFHMISSYLLFGFKARFAEELVMQSLANGRKPVVVVDNTGDGVIGYKLGHDSGEDDEDELEDVFDAALSDDARILTEMPHKRYTLEGNIFAAVQLMGGKRLGEKVIYTAHDGELRNAMLLRNERLDKLLGPLDKALEARTATVSFKEEHLTAFLKVWMGLLSVEATPIARVEMGRQIAMLVSGKDREAKETNRVFERLMADFDGVRERLLTAMADAKGTGAIVLGGDPFGAEESPATRFRKVVVDERDPSKTYYRRSTDRDAVAFAAKRMGASDMICVGDQYYLLCIANAKSGVVQQMGRDWTASVAGMRLTNKFVGAQLTEAEAAAALLTASKAESLSITARGAFRGLLEGLTAEGATLSRPAVTREIAREVDQETSSPSLI